MTQRVLLGASLAMEVGLRLDSGAGVGKPLVVSSAEGQVGREAELALAAVAVRELSEGRASVLVIEGEAGIGKTRLVQSIVDDARRRDLGRRVG